jgi:signal transduction histidine kinase/CheY-like chemotaxis protein
MYDYENDTENTILYVTDYLLSFIYFGMVLTVLYGPRSLIHALPRSLQTLLITGMGVICLLHLFMGLDTNQKLSEIIIVSRFVYIMCSATLLTMLIRMRRVKESSSSLLESSSSEQSLRRLYEFISFSVLIFQHRFRLAISAEKDGLHDVFVKETHKIRHGLEDLLNFCRLKLGVIELVPSSFCIRPLIENIRTAFVPMLGDRVKLVTLVDNNVPRRVYADEEAYRVILSNIVSNAVKNTHAGTIVLSLAQQTFGTLQIECRDTGCGMERNELEKAFYPLRKRPEQSHYSLLDTHIHGSELGVGLFLCKSLLKLMNGTIHIESESKQYTQVTINIPIVWDPILHAREDNIERKSLVRSLPKQASRLQIDLELEDEKQAEMNARKGEEKEQNEEKKEEEKTKHGEVILFVDDSASYLHMQKKVMQRRGYEVMTALGGHVAIEQVKTFHQQIGIIFMDMRMPDINGSETTNIIHNLCGDDIPIIGLSANHPPSNYKEQGFAEFLVKPVSTDQIIACIKKYKV